MKKLQSRDYNRLGDIQNVVMDDLCNIHHITFSSGTYATKITEVDVVVSGVACGFHMTNGSITKLGETLVVEYDALLRIASSQPIGINDKIDLIEKGVTVVSGTFAPYSSPVINSSVQHISLKRVIS